MENYKNCFEAGHKNYEQWNSDTVKTSIALRNEYFALLK